MFEEQYEKWLVNQRKSRKGEALRKLNEDHTFSEKLFAEVIWWPVVGSFDCLHAEYEVTNYRDGAYYLDFALLRPPYRINWEVDDFSSHAKNLDRRGFNYERDRQNHLMLDGWQIYRLPLDAIKEHPRQCQQFVLQVMGKLYGGGYIDTPDLSLEQREIMRLALRLQRSFTPLEVCMAVGISNRFARTQLHKLSRIGLLEPVGGKQRVRSYRVTNQGRYLYLG
jgi:hypothetical protein